jgi:hypothetical protein
MSECGCHFEARNEEQRRVLRVLLAINAVMFVLEIFAGIVTESAGLLADPRGLTGREGGKRSVGRTVGGEWRAQGAGEDVGRGGKGAR